MNGRIALGFTLAELLISLAILGCIATFTIPKILTAQQDGRYNATAHEAAGMISQAYQLYQQNNTVTASTKPSDLTPYMNYTSFSAIGSIDHVQTGNIANCGPGGLCIKLHNGAVIQPYDAASMGGTSTTNGMLFFVDPDGVVTDGTTNGPGKSIQFILYYNGRLSSLGKISSNTVSGDTTRNPCPTCDPPWFSW